MRTEYFAGLFIMLLVFVSCSSVNRNKADSDNKTTSKPNVLFIAVDDLRPELGCYGNSYIKSPNIDKLAKSGFLFTRHYVNIPTCGASRNCLLTGKLPVTRAYLGNNITAKTLALQPEKDIPETFIHQLKRNGYYTVGIGKISHSPDGYIYGYLEPKSDKRELPYSWNEMLLDDKKWGSGHNAFFGYADGTNRNTLKKMVKPYECADVDDTAYVDGLTAQLAIKKLGELKKRGKPFFLGIGFFKPHLPFTSPKKYWDLYDEDKIQLAPFRAIPANSSKASLHNSGEFNQYKLGEEKASLEKNISDKYARKLRHAYFACVSFTDAQIGKVLNELDRLGLADNTIVVLWGDHGWHLGDQMVWGKHTIFERALHSPLIIKVPGENGEKISKIVSTTDIYPTLMELCNIPVNYKLDGESLTSLMKNHDDENWRNTAYSYFINGISVRTENYRLMKYFRNEKPDIELYNHKTDPNETKNIAAQNSEIVNKLMPVWEKGNTGLYQK